MARREQETTRTCIVTRRVEPVERLIRFVAAPDGDVVADLRRRLPGRGVWVTADAEHVRQAVRKQLFRRGLGGSAAAAPDLADRVGDRLRDAATAALSLARKAGAVVTGFTKVESALATKSVIAVIHADTASRDGVAKIGAAVRRHYGEAANDLPVVRTFTLEELSLAFGQPHVIHAALLAGSAGANVLQRIRSLAEFIGEDRGVGELGSLAVEPSEVSAGS
ncbi:MAG: RNA-binding protein [Hyphomicrobiales bacterium]|nr:RNA-binding protein [Hyphomicrobiales bacterium]